MLSAITTAFQNEQCFIQKNLKDLNGSICTQSITPVLDFIEMKQKICAVKQKPLPRSVNALLFIKDRLFFVHLERFYPGAYPSYEDLERAFLNGDIPIKIDGTIIALSDIVSHTGHDFETLYSNSTGDKIDIFVLMDKVPPNEDEDSQYLRANIGYLDKINSPSDSRIIGKLIILSCEHFDNYIARG